jgi:hypothetical protein
MVKRRKTWLEELDIEISKERVVDNFGTVQEGEEILGVVDPRIRKIFCLGIRLECEATKELEDHAMYHHSAESGSPGVCCATVFKKAMEKRRRSSLLLEISWASVRDQFPTYRMEIGIRAGWKAVTWGPSAEDLLVNSINKLFSSFEQWLAEVMIQLQPTPTQTGERGH